MNGWRGAIPPPVPYVLNRQSPQAQGLVAWWPAIGARGIRWVDRAGGLVLTGSGLVADHAVPTLKAAKFWTGAGYYNVADCQIVNDISDAISISLWARVAVVNGDLRVMIVKSYTLTTDYTFVFYRSGADWVGRLRVASGLEEVRSTNTFADTSWQHLVMTYDGVNLLAYVNGIQTDTEPANGAIVPGTLTELRIGERADGSYFWDGDLADIRIYNRAIPAAEVYAMYAPQTRFDLYAVPMPSYGKAPVTAGNPWYQRLQQRVGS